MLVSSAAPTNPFSRAGRTRRRSRALVPTLIILGVLGILFAVFTSFWTDRLWYDSVGRVDVFGTTLLTKAGMFVVFALLMAGSVVANALVAYRLRPRYRPMSVEQQSLDRYRDALDPVRKWVVGGLAVFTGLMAGGSAASEWSTFLQWRHGGDFGKTDPVFHKDISFFVFDYPWYRFLVGFGFALVVVGLIVAVVTHYLYGGIRLQTVGDKVTAGAQAHLSLLVGLFVLLKAVAYWLDRYGLLTSDHSLTNGFTGATYTDLNALLPANTILAVIALVCALLFFANVVRRSFTLPVIGLGLLILSAVLLGGVWPAIVQQFQVRPSEPQRESTPISRNIAATRDAYDLSAVKPEAYAAATTATPVQLQGEAKTVPGVRLLDPNVVSSTFQQLQQVRQFYQFPDPLDVDRYTVNGVTRDVVVAVRDIDVAGIPEGQRSWVNEHASYTHGYGFFAALGNRTNSDGRPVFIEDGNGNGELGDYQKGIYFGENSPSYSIVGAPKGSTPVEYDVPDSLTKTTYTGAGGVPIGSLFNKLLYAAKFQEGNILLSNFVNDQSRILYDRHPRDRVEKVAPWLTVDGDPFPAVVDKHIVWVVDGYTTLDDYPYAQRVSLEAATQDTRVIRQAVAGQPERTVNYFRNSVKATVDAYTGAVTLYAWDPADPVLKAWEGVYPDAVQPRSEIPADLMEHLRYPTDLFKVQRELLKKYHVTDPGVFYGGQERWVVPDDPSATGTANQPPYYLSIKTPGSTDVEFSLTTAFTRQQPPNLASFMAVDAEATSPDYGTIRVLELPSESQSVQGPGQVANAFETDQEIANATLALRNSGARTADGNLLTLPFGGGFLNVQPLYVERSAGTGRYPLLRLVFVAFGDKVGVGDNLQIALDDLFGSGTTTAPPGAGNGGGGGAGGGSTSTDLKSALAAAQKAFEDAQAAQREGRWADYGAALDRLQKALDDAARLGGVGTAGAATASASPSPSP